MNTAREIPLTKGKVALVDDADFEAVSQHKWHACQNKKTDIWYAHRHCKINNKRRLESMHRFILKTDAHVDHKNRNGLDNRRENLRPATRSQNMANTKMSIRNTSGYRGVTLRKHDHEHGYPRPWYAKIKKNGTTRSLGTFATAIEAAKAYDEAAKLVHGEFASLNFPNTGEQS